MNGAHAMPPLPEEPRRDPARDEHDPHAQGELGFDLPPPAQISPRRAAVIAGVALAALVTALAAGLVPRWRASRALAAETQAASTDRPRVEVVAPKVASSERALELPGSVQPLEETIVYPRASGYVRKWLVDIGDHVKQGEVLAEIDTPELDQQLAQARAQLAQAQAGIVQAKATARFSKQNLERYKQMVPAGIASQQDLDKQAAQADVDQAAVQVAAANVAAMQANIQRLTDLKKFANVVAPFDGTVTTRNIERGSLVTEGSTATPLFKVSATDPVRIFVQVPQDVAPSIRSDVPAKVKVREFPGRAFEGKVTRAAGSLDPATRTMTTEVRVPNPKGELLAGMYAEVAIELPTPHRVLSLPATALVNDAQGVRLATVDKDDRVHFVRVTVERDTGPTIEIASGLAGDERVVKLPSAELVEGRAVDVAAHGK